MGTIETTYDSSRDLTIVKAMGMMTSIDFMDWTATYYSGKTTLLVLWDLTEANLSEINTGNLRDDATLTKNHADKRKGGKTAFVSADTLSYGLCRMLEAFYDLAKVPFEVEVFRSLDEAMGWLGVKE